LGAGNGGFATAADLALAGHRVRLWSRAADALGPIVERATITLDAEGRHGTAQLERATTDLGEAVEGAEVLIVPLPATSHAELSPAVRPCADALDVALTNAGPVIHPPLVLLNTGAIDGGSFDVHAAGTTPSVRRLIDAVDAERVATRRGWGYAAPHYELATY